MDLTSTSSLVLFPTTSMQPSQYESTEQYHEIARIASWQIQPPRQQQYHHPPTCQLPSQRVAAMSAEAQAKRRQEREELKRIQITSFRGKDGLLSPPPLPAYARRKKRSIVGINARAMESSPELSPASSTSSLSSDTLSSAPGTPHPYGSKVHAASAVDLRVYTPKGSDGVGLGISGPKSAPAAPITRGFNSPPRRPSPFRNNNMDDALLGVGLIQPPSPSILRPKSFWKNHPRSALTSLAWSPSSQVVRRSTFVAAGMNIDQGHWDGNSDQDPFFSEPTPPSPPAKDNKGSDIKFVQELDEESAKQNEAVRAFGRSLWNASTLALAVESRTRGVIKAGPAVCVPGEF